jgi:hypothetical protein
MTCTVGSLLAEPSSLSPTPFRIAGRRLQPTVVFDSYWRFAAARHSIYTARLQCSPRPWTDDDILVSYRFTNVFRAADRVSQFLIGNVIQGDEAPVDPFDVVFRTLLFKIFNREKTWRHLELRVGPVVWADYDFDRYRAALDEAAVAGPIYSAAYLMPPPRLGESRKHANHLRLVEMMMRDGVVKRILGSTSLRDVYKSLLIYPGLGPFLAFQYAIDLNYADILHFDEDEYVVAGPGAKDGIRKCFGREAAGIESEVIRFMVDTQEEHFDRLGLSFPGLFGRRLHLIDAQNLFCEVDKYARVRHPEVEGISGRSRIKQRFRALGPLAPPVFPERWGLTPGHPTKDVNSEGCPLDTSSVKVHHHSSTIVGAERAPGRVSGQNRLFPN